MPDLCHAINSTGVTHNCVSDRSSSIVSEKGKAYALHFEIT